MTAHSKITIGRMLAGIALGLLALALACGQTALASPAHAAHAKQKKKPSRQVLVHCASVTVTCTADAHNRGPTGPQGATGKQGPAGTAGHGVADRIRWSGTIASSDGVPAVVPLAAPSFGQEAGEDERVLGLATVTAPTGECESGKAHEGELEGIVTLDGAPFGIITLGSGSYAPGSQVTVPIVWTGIGLTEELVTDIGVLPVTSSAQTHTLAIALGDDCNASSTTHFVLSSVAIDVLRSN
jgi:hypothetical protein